MNRTAPLALAFAACALLFVADAAHAGCGTCSADDGAVITFDGKKASVSPAA